MTSRLVTTSRLHAVRYKLAFERYLEDLNGYPNIRPLVAFSGTVRDPETGVEYTEPGMNTDVITGRPIGEAALPNRFPGPDYQVLLAANKYQTAVDRFKVIDNDERRHAFRDKLAGYVRVYAFLSQIVPYADPELEMLYSYGRFLWPHLPLDRNATIVQVGDKVALQYYRLERVFSGGIEVKEGEAEYIRSPTEVGTGIARDQQAPPSEIIETLNERFGTQFSEEDQLFFQQI